jgi:diacylglycerol kinase family enzyme
VSAPEVAVGSVRARRWCARGALALVVLAFAVLLAFAGRRGLWLVGLTAATGVVMVAALFWFLLMRGPVRWLALGLAVGAPAAVLGVFAVDRLLWVAVLSAALLALGVAAARFALRPDPAEWRLPAVEAPPPRRPFLVMNPRSGGGKVARFALRERAEELGAEVALLDGPADVQQLARDALARGADLLGVAGGDGTQALVAQVAADHDVPFLVVSAGTRNHFALDLGLDRRDPARCLDALRDGVEARVDLGEVNGRPFVNNASFGAYAEIVENPGYRADKARTALDALPDLLSGRRGAQLVAEADGLVTADGPQALLVSNNPYEDTDLAGMGRRSRLDRGVLGMIAVRVDSARQAVGLVNGATTRGLRRAVGHEVVVTSDRPEVPVGIDGETVRLRSPVHCRVRAGALRIRLPRQRPGIRPPRGRLDWAALWGLALGRTPPGRPRDRAPSTGTATAPTLPGG